MELAFHLWPAASSMGDHTPTPPRPGKKIALLHGMGGTGALWRPIAASLEDRHTLIAFDQRGHGRSRSVDPGSYGPLDYGTDVIETLAKHQLHPVWLIGHSMGVRTACAAAHLKPEWVQGMILVDLGFSGPAGGGLGDGLANFLRVLPQQFASREEARAFMTQHCPDPSIAQYLMAVSVRSVDGRVSFPFDHSALIRTIEAVRDTSVRPWVRELGQRGMPILVLRGARSGVWSHEDYEKEKRAFADLSSIEFREIEGAGHGLPFEQRARFVAEVERWVDSPQAAR